MGKAEIVFKFTGACVGNSVFVGKKVYDIGADCGRKIIDLSRSSLSSLTGIASKAVPRSIREKTRERDEPTLKSAESPAQPASRRIEEPRKPRLTWARLKKPFPPPNPPRRKDKPRARKPAPPGPKPDQIKAAAFGGATEKFMFKKAAADLGHIDAGIRAEAAGVLGKIRHELSAQTLAARYSAEPSAQVRKSIVNALTALGIGEGVPTLKRAMNDSSAAVRLAAVMGIYSLGGAAYAPVLIGGLNDDSTEVRRMTACCVGWLGQSRMATDLQPLLSDKAARVRCAAVVAMGSLGNREVVSALIERLDDSDDTVRSKALEAIEEITGKTMNDQYPEDAMERRQSIARWRHWWNEQSPS